MRVHDTGRRWERGDDVALRLVGAGRGHVWVRPAVVIRDDEAFVVLYIPVGTRIARIQLAEGGRTEPPLTNEMDLLRVMRPGAEHSVCLFFDAGRGRPPYWEWLANEGRFRGWKIDIEAPFRRTSIGFDTTDNSLDVAVTPVEGRRDHAVAPRGAHLLGRGDRPVLRGGTPRHRRTGAWGPTVHGGMDVVGTRPYVDRTGPPG